MESFEWIILLLIAAAALAEFARRIGAPYPTLLALGGVGLAFLPHSPGWVLDPELALTLFVAPVLLDAAYDTSLRDLRANWRPVAGLVVAAVGTTVIGVAVACRWLVPDMPWPVAVALGAIVAPPDAAAATAVMRQVGLPHRVLSILEGESLLNDASALFVYKLALMAMVATGPLSSSDYLPVFGLTVFGSIATGVGLGFLLRPLLSASEHVPISLIVQFACTFGVWIAAERVGLSGILTMVAFAMTMARGGGPRIPARMRVPIFAVWETVVFVLNALAFVLIGMQLRPIWERLGSAEARLDAIVISATVLGVVIATRFLWVMIYGAFVMRHVRKVDEAKRPNRSWGASLVVSWAGMRGIVTLAAAFAVPENLADGSPFPYRDLILLCAFGVVFGTLVVQGFSMKPLIRLVKLRDEDPVAAEVRAGRTLMYQALLDAIKDDESLHARLLRKEYQAVVDLNTGQGQQAPLSEVPGGAIRRLAIAAARQKAIDLRAQEVIGDNAYRLLVQELDWAELAAGGNEPA
jgi:Na+/H+ antiporter